MASSTSTDPAQGLFLDVITKTDGTPFFVRVPGVRLGAFEVPNAGIHLDRGTFIVCHTGLDRSLPTPDINAYSVLTRFDETTRTFTLLRTISTRPNGKFITPSLHTSGSDVMMFGLGAYRASDVYLATIPASSFDTGAHERDDPFRPRRSGTVIVARRRARLRDENHGTGASFAPCNVASQSSPALQSWSLVAIQAIKHLFATAPHHHPPGCEPYFPQEARGFVQLNSSPHPLHSRKHASRPASHLRGSIEFRVGGCGVESYELAVGPDHCPQFLGGALRTIFA